MEEDFSMGEADTEEVKQWLSLCVETEALSQELTEQLRLILEPTKASKFKGDYKSGKKLNMRKIIPYIASGFRKDKIWLRRTKASSRDYQVSCCVVCSGHKNSLNTPQDRESLLGMSSER